MKLLEKIDIIVNLRISQSDYDKLKFVADSIGWTVARLIRAYTEKFVGGVQYDNKK